MVFLMILFTIAVVVTMFENERQEKEKQIKVFREKVVILI